MIKEAMAWAFSAMPEALAVEQGMDDIYIYIYILFIHISYVIYLINGGFNGKILTITNLYPLVI